MTEIDLNALAFGAAGVAVGFLLAILLGALRAPFVVERRPEGDQAWPEIWKTETVTKPAQPAAIAGVSPAKPARKPRAPRKATKPGAKVKAKA